MCYRVVSAPAPLGGKNLALLSKAHKDQVASKEPPSSIHKLTGSTWRPSFIPIA